MAALLRFFAKLVLPLLLLPLPLAAEDTPARYTNPIIHADYSDPDVIRVGEDYYLVSSSFQAVPALPILHSRDLVNWTIVAHAVDRLPAEFDLAQHGNGMWAPSIRHHDGFFWIYVGDPDRGIFMTRARDVRGPWEPLTLVKEAKGWIDPCPLWDDDGSMYLVHAWAKSRAGFNSVLTVNRLSADGRSVLDQGTLVFDGRDRHPTIEGPKFYKRNGWYYIFAPAGGVKNGWQTVLRSKNVFGPYEDKIVLEQGSTAINGPHQGAWVESPDGASWFIHFQDRGAYGRVVHLQPMTWVNEWPDIAGPTSGGQAPSPVHDLKIQTSDEFDGPALGLQWQWHGNPHPAVRFAQGHLLPQAGEGSLRLNAVPMRGNLWKSTSLLLQKFPSSAFAASVSIDPKGLRVGERAGLLIMGADYAALVIERMTDGLHFRRVLARDADKGSPEIVTSVATAGDGPVQLEVRVFPEAIARFGHGGGAFVARPGRWIGARVGLFVNGDAGYADFDWFHVRELHPTDAPGLVVAQDGTGDFTTIQAALDAIPSDNDVNRTIRIRNGSYREKVMITTSHVSLVGEDRDKARIEFAELRRNWRAKHPDDWGAAVINIAPEVTDVIIGNLTVHNDYGRKHGDHDHQFAIRSMGNSTRIAVLHANVIADGGDTFSLWNSDSGLSYANDCYFEGWVDYVAPRGWSYITNSRFFGHNDNASIWHDGSKDKDQKLVIRRSRFDGVAGFPLGRNHRDAQFYILDSTFSKNMADRPIYPANAPDPRQWGERYYYANARRDGGDFAWHADNLQQAEGSPRDEDITASWTFDGRWDPASLPAVLPFATVPYPEDGWQWVDPTGVTLRWTPAVGTSQSENARDTGPLEPGKTYSWQIDDGPVWTFRADPRTTRIALVGDSTVTEKSGWGRGFKSHVAETAAVLNLARGGRSSKSFINEGHWTDVLRRKPTHVLLQFGHNDVPGKGLDRETDLPAFRTNMARYVDEARAAGAKPILLTSLTRRYFKADGRVESDLDEYAEATRQVAAEKGVPLVDLHSLSIELLDRLGPAVSPALGPVKADGTLDKTHLNDEGSALFGALVANEVRRVFPELAPHIRATTVPAPVPPWSARMAESVMKRTPDPMWLDATETPRWEYTPGLVLKSVLDVWQRTGDERYWKYVKAYYDGFIDADGNIRAYRKDEYNIDRINPGKPLFTLYEKTRAETYRRAIETLRQQMREHPRTSEGGFWHKKRYPSQMWLDGLYMGAPFLAQYAKMFNEPALFDDVINQFVLMEKHARDDKTGLLFHGWDESRKQKWSDPKTGRSPAFWGRAMGWYAMGLVETLDFVPPDHPRRGELTAIVQRLAEAVARVQDPKSGVWWQVLDQGEREGNYLESSASAMFTFSLLKASRLGYIDMKYRHVARRAYQGILREFIEVDKDGLVNIHRVCQVAGLGGDPERGEKYRAGTYDYYVTEKIRSNDPKAVGPFIFAALEAERGF